MKLTHRFRLYAVALCIPLLLTPQITQAQTPPDRVVLLQTIQLLLTQIQQLQLLLDARLGSESVSERVNNNDLLDDFPGDVISLHEVSGSLQLPSSASTIHNRYVDQLRTILPDTYKNYIDDFVVFDNHPADIAAFVAVSSDGREVDWMYGVSNEELLKDPTTDDAAELMVHEFAHIFSLDQLITGQETTNNCHEYFDAEGCYVPGSYLEQFVDTFWDEELLDELVDAGNSRNTNAALEAFYDQYSREFVTEYAATDPSEDFAESFAWYVLDIETESATIAEEKIEFMDSFSTIRSYKEHIQSEL